MEKALASGGGVLFLVPEVALAPQTVDRLRAGLEARRTGGGLAQSFIWWVNDSMHGATLLREKRIVVGARSAVFARL